MHNVKDLPTYFEVVGTDIYLGSHRVGSINPDMWATMTDIVIDMLGNDTTQLEKDQAEALKNTEDEYSSKLEDFECEVNDLQDEVSGLEESNRELQEIIDRIENAEGVLGRIKELEDENKEFREKIMKLNRQIRDLTPRPKRRYNKQVA